MTHEQALMIIRSVDAEPDDDAAATILLNVIDRMILDERQACIDAVRSYARALRATGRPGSEETCNRVIDILRGRADA